MSDPQVRREGVVVGGRERIDAEVAEALMTRLHAAGLELHRALALALSAEARSRIESAIDNIDHAIHVIHFAALGFDSRGEDGSPP